MQKGEKSVGSIYVNTKKGTDKATQDQITKALNWLKDQNVYLSISVKNGGTYDKYTGFFNGFKRSAKDPDIMIRPTAVGGTGGQAAKAETPKSGLPF